MVVGVKRATRRDNYIAADLGGCRVIKKKTVWLNARTGADGDFSARASLNGGVAIQMHTRTQLNGTAARVLIDQHAIADENLCPQPQIVVANGRVGRDVPLLI